MKGQVAVENLMTYGWMLLAVGLVSGSIVSSGVTDFCSNEASGFGVNQLKLEDFGYTVGTLKFILRNDDTQGFSHKVEQINLTDRENGKSIVDSPGKVISQGVEQNFSFDGFSEVENCRTMDVQIKYDRGDVLESQTVTGTIRTDLSIVESDIDVYSPPYFETSVSSINSPVNLSEGEEMLEVDYTLRNTGDETGERDVKMFFQGSEIEASTVELASGETQDQEFSYDVSGLSPGVYSFEVDSGDSEVQRSVQVVGESGEDVNVVLEDGSGNSFTDSSTVELYSSGSLLEGRLVSDGDTSFELTPGDYTVKASSDGYWDANTSFSVSDSPQQVVLTLLEKPELQSFQVVDNSQCNQWSCWQYSGDISWTVTDPNGNLNSVDIYVNGNNVHSSSSASGSYTHQAWTGGGTEYSIEMRAVYDNMTICRSVTDTEDGTDPSGDDYRMCGSYFKPEITGLNRYLELGEGLHTEYSVTNDGTDLGTQQLELSFGGQAFSSNTHTLPSGGQTSGTLNYVPGSTGSFDTGVGSENSSISRSVTVKDNSGLLVTNMSSTDVGYLNSSISPSFTLVGNGSSLSQDAELRIGDDITDTDSYTVLANMSTAVGGEVKSVEFQDVFLNSSTLSPGETSLGVEYAGGLAASDITLRLRPEIEDFTVTDDSTCNQWSCWEYRGITDWNVTDPNGNLQEVRITINGNTVHTSTDLEGSYTHQAWTGGGTEYDTTFQAIYPDTVLCRQVTDVENGENPDPSAYSSC